MRKPDIYDDPAYCSKFREERESPDFTESDRREAIRKAKMPVPGQKVKPPGIIWHFKHAVCMFIGHDYGTDYALAGWRWKDCRRCKHTSPYDKTHRALLRTVE